VYYFDHASTSWQPVDGGLSTVYIYEKASGGEYRVVGICNSTSQIVINSSLFPELQYQKASETFHNWADAVNMYGLNFASLPDANNFSATLEDSVARLLGKKITISTATNISHLKEKKKALFLSCYIS
jgi:hypothetical protein